MHLDSNLPHIGPDSPFDTLTSLELTPEKPQFTDSNGRKSSNSNNTKSHSDDQEPTGKIRATILVADDDQMVLRVVRRLLERQDMRVLTAGDGEDALEVYREHQDEIDAVILDIVMPKLDGLETLKVLRSMDPSVKILLVSGYCAKEIPEDDPALFMMKPYRATDLADKLDEVFSKKLVS